MAQKPFAVALREARLKQEGLTNALLHSDEEARKSDPNSNLGAYGLTVEEEASLRVFAQAQECDLNYVGPAVLAELVSMWREYQEDWKASEPSQETTWESLCKSHPMGPSIRERFQKFLRGRQVSIAAPLPLLDALLYTYNKFLQE